MATKTLTKTEPKKKAEAIIASSKKNVSKTSSVATADLKASRATNVKTKAIDEKAKKTVIVKKETVKIEPKKAAAKVTAKATAKKAEPAKASAKETTKKAATKTTTAKKTTAKKTTVAKAASEKITISLNVQYAGRELSAEYITERCVEDYVAAGNKKSSIKTMETYVKVEDNTVYYVVDGTFRGHVVLD